VRGGGKFSGRRNPRPRWIKPRVIWLGLVLLAGGLVLFLVLRPGPSLGEHERVNILILGLDQIEGTRSRNDTNLLLSIKGREVVLLALPRDLRLKFPDGEFHKLNAAYSYGGVRLARRVISDFLGVPIHFYAVIDYQGFVGIIDQLGGVTLYVEKHLKYDDEAQNLHIDIPPGEQLLDGAQALNYIRYRDETGDLGRLERQGKFIRALLEKGIQFRSLRELQALARTISRYISTNLSLVDMYALAGRFRGLEPDQVKLVQVPGEPVRIEGVDYLEPKIVETRNLVADLLLGIDVLIPGEVRLGVLNGCGVTGLARRTAAYLRERGFAVVEVGNAEHFNYKHTFLIDLKGDPRKAELLSGALPERLQPTLEVVTPEEFARWGEGSLDRLAQKGYNLAGMDLLLILGEGFELGG